MYKIKDVLNYPTNKTFNFDSLMFHAYKDPDGVFHRGDKYLSTKHAPAKKVKSYLLKSVRKNICVECSEKHVTFKTGGMGGFYNPSINANQAIKNANVYNSLLEELNQIDPSKTAIELSEMFQEYVKVFLRKVICSSDAAWTFHAAMARSSDWDEVRAAREPEIIDKFQEAYRNSDKTESYAKIISAKLGKSSSKAVREILSKTIDDTVQQYLKEDVEYLINSSVALWPAEGVNAALFRTKERQIYRIPAVYMDFLLSSNTNTDHVRLDTNFTDVQFDTMIKLYHEGSYRTLKGAYRAARKLA